MGRRRRRRSRGQLHLAALGRRQAICTDAVVDRMGGRVRCSVWSELGHIKILPIWKGDGEV